MQDRFRCMMQSLFNQSQQSLHYLEIHVQNVHVQKNESLKGEQNT